MENQARSQRGEAPLPSEDLGKLFRPVPQPPRIDALLAAGQVSSYCDRVSGFTSQNLGRLFMAQALDNKD